MNRRSFSFVPASPSSKSPMRQPHSQPTHVDMRSARAPSSRLLSSTSARAFVTAMALLITAALGAPRTLAAQAATARPVGAVRGLELQLDGALVGVRGGELRWWVTAYEVHGMDTLRLARDVDIELTSSLDPTAAPRVSRVDAHGRALVTLPIPPQAPDTFQVVVRATRGPLQRRFELHVSTEPGRRLSVSTLRPNARAEGLLPVAVIAGDAQGAPLADLEVQVGLRDGSGRQVGPRVTVRTDASGLALHAFRLPREAWGQLTVHASSGEGRQRIEAHESVSVDAPRYGEALLVAVAPSQRVLAPGGSTDVDIVVRNAEGRPIEGALLEVQDERSAEERRAAPLRTDARGRARYTHRVLDRDVSGGFVDRTIHVRAAHELEGAGSGSAALRIATVERVGTFSVEAGALVPSLGGRVYVRSVEVDGTPSGAGLDVEVRGPRIGSLRGTTDASGVAVIEVPPLTALAAGARDRCGGDAGTAIDVLVRGAAGREACLVLEPDGVARVRVDAPLVRAGQPLRVEVARAPLAARLPVAIRVLERASSRVVAAAVLDGAQTRAELTLPSDAAGRLVVLARPLLGNEEREVRGGSAQVLVVRGDAFAIDARAEASPRGALLHLGAVPSTRALVVAAPLEELEALDGQRDPLDLGVAMQVALAQATPALIEAALAVTTPRDTSAASVLRGQPGRLEVIAAPVPASPLAILRDPWRAQARFVTGRLALLFRAIELRVAAAVPERLEDVAVQTNGRWDFNAQIVAALSDDALGGEGATGLGGEPITVEALRAFDPAFTYDNVARRITRERLFRVLVALRRFVLSNGYDIPWARLGDPSTWLAHTSSLYDPAIGQLSTRELVDGWGRPFVLAPVRGRARYAAWQPLDGWEVYSLGPDGRANTPDDVVDPTARVLPSGSPYAQSVGEDALVARLTGVELGRATVLALERTSGVVTVAIPHSAEGASTDVAEQQWQSVPRRLEAPLDPLALRRPLRATDGAWALVPLDGQDVTLALDEEPRTWGIGVLARSAAGVWAIKLVQARLGSPLLIEGALPERVRVGEPVEVELRVTNTASRDLSLTLEARAQEGRGEGRLSLQAPASLSLPAETSAAVRVRLEATTIGTTQSELRWLEAGHPLRTARFAQVIDRGLHPIRTRAALVSSAGGHLEVSLDGRSSARDGTARVVVMRPTALGLDPDLDEARVSDPALVAWALTMGARPLDERLRGALMQERSGPMPRLSLAAALAVWSAADPDDAAAVAAAVRTRAQLGAQGSQGIHGGSGLAESAAVLAALASGGVFELADAQERALDPVAQQLAYERSALRRALVQQPAEPSLLARASAALLLADPRDAYGRAMFERVRGHLEVLERGGMRGQRVVPSTALDQPIERLVATLALSVAARQLGDHALAEQLVRGAAFDDHVVLRAGGEALFWWLAAGTYGALSSAVDTPPSDAVTVVVGGRTLTASLAEGIAVVALGDVGPRPSVSVRVEGPVVVRAESLAYSAYEARSESAMALSLLGEPGDARHASSLELTVQASAQVRSPVLHVQLPTGVEADDALLEALRGASGVVSVEPRTPGLLRLRLTALAQGTSTHIPLPLRWGVRGTVRGLAVVAFDADTPGQMSVLPARTFTIP